MSAHLGRRISALVDDQLPSDERERALAHLADCAMCALAVDSEQRAKLTLQALPQPEPSAAMLRDLFSLAGPGGPLPRDRSAFPGPVTRTPFWDGARPPSLGGSSGAAGGSSALSVRARPVRYALAATAVAGASLGLAFAAGAPTAAPVGPAGPTVVPAFGSMSVEHARSASASVFAEPDAVSAVLASGSGVASGRRTTSGP